MLRFILAFWMAITPALADGVSVPGVPSIGMSDAAFRFPPNSGGGGSPPAFRSSGHNAAASPSITLPSANAGDIVLVLISGYNHTSTGSTASSPNLGSFTPAFDVSLQGAVLWAVAGSNITSETITIAGPSVSSALAMSVSGANTSLPIDGAFVGTTSNTGAMSITTTHANDMVIGMMGAGSGATDSAPWVVVGGGAGPYGDVTEYQIVTSLNTYSAAFGGQTGNPAYIFAVKGL